MNRRIIYPEVISPGGTQNRRSAPTKRGPMGSLAKFLSGALLLGVSIISAALLGTVLFFVLAALFLTGCVIGLAMMWRMRKLGRQGWPASGAYVFTRQSRRDGAEIIDTIDIVREDDRGAPDA